MPENENDIKTLIKQSAGTAKSMTVGSESTTERSLDELIKADEHLAQRDAASKVSKSVNVFRVRKNSIR